MSDSDDCVKVVKIGAPVRDFTLINADVFVEARRATDLAISRGETVSWRDLRSEIDDAQRWIKRQWEVIRRRVA